MKRPPTLALSSIAGSGAHTKNIVRARPILIRTIEAKTRRTQAMVTVHQRPATEVLFTLVLPWDHRQGFIPAMSRSSSVLLPLRPAVVLKLPGCDALRCPPVGIGDGVFDVLAPDPPHGAASDL
jgi:hypothetical protein